MSFRVLCIGHAAWDLIYPVESFPEEDRKYTIPRMAETPGGPACNAAFLLGKWGVPVALVASIGNDPYSAAIIGDLRAWGVDTAWLNPDPEIHTPLSVVMVNGRTGSRTILTHKNQTRPLKLPEGLRTAGKPDIILYDGHETDAALEAIALFPDAVTVLDGGTARPGWRELIARTDCAIVSERYAAQVMGLDRIHTGAEAAECLFTLRSLGARHCAATRGGAGYVYLERHSESAVEVPAFPAITLDTTGAGDIFHGAFCAALMDGIFSEESCRAESLSENSPENAQDYFQDYFHDRFQDSLQDSLRDESGMSAFPFSRALTLAAAASAVSVERPGGRDSIPSREEARARAGWSCEGVDKTDKQDNNASTCMA